MALNPRNKNKHAMSGAQRRKLKREELAAAARRKAGTTLIKLDLTGAPNTYDEWRLEGRTVYWEMRKGRLHMDDGRALTWAAELNGRLAKMSEELYELRQMNKQLQQLQGGSVGFDADGAIEYLPADKHTNGH
jgi:hypothetical protein